MESVCEQIALRMEAVLLNATAAADRVFRSREAAVGRDETPCIFIVPGNDEGSAFSDAVDEIVLIVDIEIVVRGDPWTAMADPLAVDVHRLLMRDPDLRLLANLRKVAGDRPAKEADLTAGVLTLKYRCKYLSPADDLTISL